MVYQDLLELPVQVEPLVRPVHLEQVVYQDLLELPVQVVQVVSLDLLEQVELLVHPVHLVHPAQVVLVDWMVFQEQAAPLE